MWLILSICYHNIYVYGSDSSKNATSTGMNSSNPSNVKHGWFRYFPNQVYFLLSAYYLFTTSALIIFHKTKLLQKLKKRQSEFTLSALAISYENEDNEMPKPKALIYLLWISYSIIVPLTYAVTILFFLNESSNGFHLNQEQNAFKIWLILNLNVFNSIIITYELIISLIPLRIYHAYYSVFYATIYVILRVIFENPVKSSFFSEWYSNVILVPLVLVIHVICALAYRVKMWLYFDIWIKSQIKINIESQTAAAFDGNIQNTGQTNIIFLASNAN